jgi:hypothetical protein
MTRLVIDDNLITSLISEVAPLVSQVTGWNLDIPSLRSRVLPREQGYEEIVEGKLRLLGLQVSPKRDLITRTVEYLVESNVLAAYEPLANELMVVRENVDDSNLDGLKLILAHELTHRGQHVNHPSLFERVNQLLTSAIKGMEAGEVDLQKTRAYFEEVKPLMTLIESHASYIQGTLGKKYYPQAQIEHHFTLPVLIFRVLGYGKAAQYTGGVPQVAAAMKQGNIDGLFQGGAEVQ